MRHLILLAGAGLVACNLTTEPIGRVEVTLAVAPREVGVGDSVHFTAQAFNPTDERIPFSYGCAPAMDVRVRTPVGERLSVLTEMTEGGAFTCELGPHSHLDPGETQTLQLSWAVPDRTGTYRAVAGIRTDGGFTNTTATKSFAVR